MGKFVKFLLNICTCWFIVYGGFCGTAFACESNQIDVLGDGTQCELAKFSITTTELTADTEFRFYMSASGNFYVDWGDGTVDTITRTDTTETLYSHTFTTSGTKTIRFGGRAKAYHGYSQNNSIRFGANEATPTLIGAIAGSLGAIFPTIGTAATKQPAFVSTFSGANNITSLPENLFNGVSGARPSMFYSTFEGCYSLTSIPENLFRDISGAESYMFFMTFVSCKSIANIPENLFSGITGNAPYLFYGTFDGCSSIISIPEGLFRGIHGANTSMFQSTFYECSSLESIPENLFSGVTGCAGGLFAGTFRYCQKLKQIPSGLFRNITCISPSIFQLTFQFDTALTGYIPAELFSGLVANNSPYATNAMSNIFYGTYGLATTCPTGTVQFITGYEEFWGGKVSCVDENLVCNSGEYFPNHWYECKTCPENNYCVGGTYPYSETVSAGATKCPNNWYSPAGSSSVAQCGRILHVGDGMVYLRSTKQTTPSLNVQIGDDIFYGNMTTADVPMNSGTARKLKVSYDGVTYSVYGDTVTVPE